MNLQQDQKTTWASHSVLKTTTARALKCILKEGCCVVTVLSLLGNLSINVGWFSVKQVSWTMYPLWIKKKKTFFPEFWWCCSSSHLWLFATTWTAARQASLPFTISWSLLRSTESVMLSSHLIQCHPFILLLSIFPGIGVFSNESVLGIRWPKYGVVVGKT